MGGAREDRLGEWAGGTSHCPFQKQGISAQVHSISIAVLNSLRLLQYCFYVPAFELQGKWDLSFLTRDRTHNPLH